MKFDWLGLLFALNIFFFPHISKAQFSAYKGIGFGGACEMNELDDSPIKSAKVAFEKARTLEKSGKLCSAAQHYALAKRLSSPTDERFATASFKMVKLLFAAKEWDPTISQAKEYLAWFPDTKEAEDVQYWMAESFYNDRGTPGTDQDWTQKAQRAFSDYKQKHPAGKYSGVVDARIKECYNELARKEIVIARLYLKSKTYTAVAFRAERIAQYYKSSDYVPEALYLAAIAYTGLNRPDDVKALRTILTRVYPGTEWAARVMNPNLAAAEEAKWYEKALAW